MTAFFVATPVWEDCDAAPDPANIGAGMGQPGQPRHYNTAPADEILICRTCPLPCGWCVGGEETADWAPCPLVRIERGLPSFEQPELDALWAAGSVQYKYPSGKTTAQAAEMH